MIKTNRLAGILLGMSLIFTLIFTPTATAFAEGIDQLKDEKVMIYHRTDITVEKDRHVLSFTDASGATVYPITYNGSTYLPVRAVSSLMGENIQWDAYSQTIFIGKTLDNPSKNLNKIAEIQGKYAHQLTEEQINNIVKKPATILDARLKPRVLIMYDFIVQEFVDEQGRTVYPVNLNGTTYLPLRAIASLMKENIQWESATKTVYIGSMAEGGTAEEKIVRAETVALKDLFTQEVDLHDQATAKTEKLSEAKSLESLQMLAEAVSEDYRLAQNMTSNVMVLDKETFTAKEKIAYQALLEFVQMTEHYVLVLENICYMAAQGQDYSILAETFMNFVLASYEKMDVARAAMEEL